MGFLHGGACRTLRVPDRRLGVQGHPWFHGWLCVTLRMIPWKCLLDIFIRSVSRMGSQEWGYLADVEGSWQDAWRTGSSLTSWMYLVASKHYILKVLCQYLYFGLSYKPMSCLSHNVMDTHTDRHLANQYLYFWLSYKHMSFLSQNVMDTHTDRHLANLYKI